uniref:Uncharacterized protein n=1 Tax=Zea mays TaxID=4577 RepID=B7ZY04_MAIZE|nr:unknown [Zea mays]
MIRLLGKSKNRWKSKREIRTCLKGGGGGGLLAVEEVLILIVGKEGDQLELLGYLVQVGVLAGPVVAEPGGGGDEVPPLRREVLHLQQRRRDEERRVRVQRRRNRDGTHGSTSAPQASYLPDDYSRQIRTYIRSRTQGRPS